MADKRSIELIPGVFQLRGGSNIGLVVEGHKGLLIDAGLDRDAARRALRAVGELDVALEAVFITHAHADHFGGAHFLQRRLGVPLYAPALEAEIMEHPVMEPLFLFSGAAPIGELRHKFTLDQPCQVEHVVEPGPLDIGSFQVEVVSLPGHTLKQVGLAVNDVLFCADAVFPTETLQKHKITFCVDLDDTLAVLEELPNQHFAHFAPGHGRAYAAGDEISQVCDVNRKRLEGVRCLTFEALDGPQETSALVQRLADHFGLRLKTATAFFLTRAAILAALSSLEQAGQVETKMSDNRLLWQRT